MDGSADGGAGMGWRDGTAEGGAVRGLADGTADGRVDGSEEGDTDGAAEGVIVGAVDGAEVDTLVQLAGKSASALYSWGLGETCLTCSSWEHPCHANWPTSSHTMETVAPAIASPVVLRKNRTVKRCVPPGRFMLTNPVLSGEAPSLKMKTAAARAELARSTFVWKVQVPRMTSATSPGCSGAKAPAVQPSPTDVARAVALVHALAEWTL